MCEIIVVNNFIPGAFIKSVLGLAFKISFHFIKWAKWGRRLQMTSLIQNGGSLLMNFNFDSNSVLRFSTLYIFHFLSSEGNFILKTTRVNKWADTVSGNRGKGIKVIEW